MEDILKRDTSGECVGECRDRVREGEEERQRDIEASSFSSPDEFPNAPGARSRNEQPGVFGGRV
jgi:hypothetical protein